MVWRINIRRYARYMLHCKAAHINSSECPETLFRLCRSRTLRLCAQAEVVVYFDDERDQQAERDEVGVEVDGVIVAVSLRSVQVSVPKVGASGGACLIEEVVDVVRFGRGEQC